MNIRLEPKMPHPEMESISIAFRNLTVEVVARLDRKCHQQCENADSFVICQCTDSYLLDVVKSRASTLTHLFGTLIDVSISNIQRFDLAK